MRFLLTIAISLITSLSALAGGGDEIFSLRPSSSWHEAYPLGNGSMGAMVYGGVQQERIQTNEDTFWAGGPRSLQNPAAAEYIRQVRRLVNEGRGPEAEKIIDSKIVGPIYFSYLPFLDINLSFLHQDGKVEDYRRSLDLSTGVFRLSYRIGGVSYLRECFISYPDQAMIIRLTSSAHNLDFDASLTSKVKYSSRSQENVAFIDGQAPAVATPHYEKVPEVTYRDDCGMHFQARLIVKDTDGINYKKIPYEYRLSPWSWLGARFGIQAWSTSASDAGCADFDYFRYNQI